MNIENVITKKEVYESFFEAENLYPGLPEEAYRMSHIIAGELPEAITPSLLAIMFEKNLILVFLESKKSSAVSDKVATFYTKVPYFIQVVDAATPKEFSKEFRSICLHRLNYDPPVYGTKKKEKSMFAGIDEWLRNEK